MLEAFGLTDPGCVRSNNEDYFICDSELGIFILADGMGGANAGEYASRLSAELLYERLQSRADESDGNALEQAFSEVNSAVLQAAQRDPQLEGMGTTLLLARTAPGAAMEIATVGDSRAYQVSDGSLRQVTQDQTWVTEVGIRLGLDQEALRRHPMRHVLTMAVGSAGLVRAHCYRLPFTGGDQILLCSDGLHGVVEERVLLETLNSEKSLREKCHCLIDAARNQGGPDNITAVLIQMV